MSYAEEIENQAASWLAHRDATGETAEMPEFTAWLAADPRHRAAYLRLAAAWERTAQLKRLRLEGQPVDPDLLIRGRTSSRGGRTRLAIAASLAGVILAGTWWLGAAKGTETYRTEIGGLSRVVLRDGSTATLNTDTELRVHFTKTRREVELQHGEAQFAVAHDAARPFDVKAGGRVVRAVGTAFDVKLGHGESMEVVVTEGRVEFLEASAIGQQTDTVQPPPTVSAGEAAVVAHGKVTVRPVSSSEASRHLAWQVGELSFQGETLSEAVAEFNRYNRRKVIITDPATAGLQIGGNFQALDLDSFVAALSRSFGIRAIRADDGTLILERASAAAHD